MSRVWQRCRVCGNRHVNPTSSSICNSCGKKERLARLQAEELEEAALSQPQAGEPVARPCTCHPDDNPPSPCAEKYALSECRTASPQPALAVNVDDAKNLLVRECLFAAQEARKSNGRDSYSSRVLDKAASYLSALVAPATADGWRTKAAEDVLAERKRQVEVEGWTPEHDDEHADGQIALAAAAYARHAGSSEDDRQVNSGFVPEDLWPWGVWWKPSSRRRDLVKAGALILAEIERLDRLPAAPTATGGR